MNVPAILHGLADSKHIEREKAYSQLEVALKLARELDPVCTTISHAEPHAWHPDSAPEAEKDALMLAIEKGSQEMLQSESWEGRVGGLRAAKVCAEI